MNRLVLLDFDGTIADTWPVIRTIIPEIARKYKLKVPSETEVEELRNYGARDYSKTWNSKMENSDISKRYKKTSKRKA